MDMNTHQGVANTSYPTEVTELIRSVNGAGTGVKLQFKSATENEMNFDKPAYKNVLSDAQRQSTSFSLGGVSKRTNTSKAVLQSEDTNSGQGHGNRVCPSSS